MVLRDSDLLNFPDAPDFISEAPRLSATEIITLCEKMLPHWNALRYSRPEPEFVGEAFTLFPDFPAAD